MQSYFWIALGGALGSMARFWCSRFAEAQLGEKFPWGTLIVNVAGSLIIGFFGTITGPEGRWLTSSEMRAFVMVGICGGYTTFSSFSIQTLRLAETGQWLRAGANVLLSVALCLIAVWVGHMLAMSFNPTPTVSAIDEAAQVGIDEAAQVGKR